MAKACERDRCPSRADVEDWKTTEYRKGCRLQPCRTANTLDTQRRRAAKAVPSAVILQLSDRAGLADAIGSSRPTEPDTWDSFDVVAAVRADLDAIKPTHPMHRSLSAIAMTLANQLQMAAGSITPSARGAAAQLQTILTDLAPAKDEDEELEAFLADLLSDDDDAAQPAG
jgi:hypothetical protein